MDDIDQIIFLTLPLPATQEGILADMERFSCSFGYPEVLIRQGEAATEVVTKIKRKPAV